MPIVVSVLAAVCSLVRSRGVLHLEILALRHLWLPESRYPLRRLSLHEHHLQRRGVDQGVEPISSAALADVGRVVEHYGAVLPIDPVSLLDVDS